MKIKKLIALLIAVVIVTSSVLSVSAATLTDVTVDNSTAVKANIEDPGSVSYVITIPETVDFGTLTQPDSIDADHYAIYRFEVEATELNLKSNQGVTVYMKDANSTDNQFYLEQQNTETPFKISYDIYDTTVTVDNINTYDPINKTAEPGTYGYHLCTFLYDAQGRTQPVNLALNQNALVGQTISDIAGDYSGTITFHCSLFERS